MKPDPEMPEEEFRINIAYTPENDFAEEWEAMTKAAYLEEYGISEDEWSDMVDAGAIQPLEDSVQALFNESPDLDADEGRDQPQPPPEQLHAPGDPSEWSGPVGSPVAEPPPDAASVKHSNGEGWCIICDGACRFAPTPEQRIKAAGEAVAANVREAFKHLVPPAPEGAEASQPCKHCGEPKSVGIFPFCEKCQDELMGKLTPSEPSGSNWNDTFIRTLTAALEATEASLEEAEREKDEALRRAEALESKLAKALSLIADIESLHRHPDTGGYNGCDTEPCQWCVEAAALAPPTNEPKV